MSIDYSQESRVGKIYDDHRKFTLRVQYDDKGRPVLWSPSKYNQVRVTYSSEGLVTSIQRGNWTERRDYDNGRIITRTWANGKIWSYTFLEKVCTVLRVCESCNYACVNLKKNLLRTCLGRICHQKWDVRNHNLCVYLFIHSFISNVNILHL